MDAQEQTIETLPSPHRTQTLSLSEGWNAVYLEVEPLDLAPSRVFANLPIDIVARYFSRRSAAQFISNPAEEDFNKPEWGVWYAPDRPDHFLTSLHAIYGNTPYLIHATEAFRWSLDGKVHFERLRWQSDCFNFQGFTVDPNAPPIFATYFSGSDGKIGQRIYRLTDEKWVKVTDPGTTRMRSGEACWIYCNGRTDYQGPLNVSIEGVESLHLGYGGTSQIKLGNRLDQPAVITIEKVTSGGGQLPILQAVRELAALATTYPPLPSTSYFALGANDTRALDLYARPETIKGEPWALLKISTNAGAQVWVPVTAEEKASAASTR